MYVFFLMVAAAAALEGSVGVKEPLPVFAPHPSAPGRDPSWVSLEDTLTAEGNLGETVFSPGSRQGFRSQVRPAPESKTRVPLSRTVDPLAGLADCTNTPSTTVFDQFFESSPDRTITDLTRSSSAIYEGTIIQATAGFLYGSTGSLLTIRVDGALRGEAPVTRRIYVYYPYAQARAGNVVMCRADLHYPMRPQLGDHILFFAVHKALDEAGTLFEPAPTHLLLERPSGGLQVSPWLNETFAPRTLESVIDRARHALTNGDGR